MILDPMIFLRALWNIASPVDSSIVYGVHLFVPLYGVVGGVVLYCTVLYCTVLYLFGPLYGVVGGVGQDAALEGDVLPCVDQGGVVTTLSEQPHLGLVCNIR